MEKNVLVIGGAGYIGSHVVFELIDQGWRVTILDNLSSGLRQNLHPQARFVEGDLLDRALLQELLREGYQSVVYLAAKKAAGESMVKPELYCQQNLGGGQVLLEEMAQSPSKNLIFSSTAAVYGNPQYLPLDEGHPTNPMNYYGYTKLSFEQNLAWFAQLKGLRFVVLRYFNAAGYDLRGRITGLEQNPANLIPLVMEALLGERDELRVFGQDYNTKDGTGERDYIHVTDLARAHRLAAGHLNQGGENLTVNLGTGAAHTVLEIIQEAEQISGKKVPYKVVGRREGDPCSVLADYALAQEKLGWVPKFSALEPILSSTWKAYLANQAQS